MRLHRIRLASNMRTRSKVDPFRRIDSPNATTDSELPLIGAYVILDSLDVSSDGLLAIGDRGWLMPTGHSFNSEC